MNPVRLGKTADRAGCLGLYEETGVGAGRGQFKEGTEDHILLGCRNHCKVFGSSSESEADAQGAL